MPFATPGSILIVVGIILVLIGLGVAGWLGPVGRLPGDILIEREGFRLYFPIATLILISVVVSLILWIIK
ncbi:MAG: DUF2905 domain-containing protein [Candidatus Paceibacterota bacterium]